MVVRFSRDSAAISIRRIEPTDVRSGVNGRRARLSIQSSRDTAIEWGGPRLDEPARPPSERRGELNSPKGDGSANQEERMTVDCFQWAHVSSLLQCFMSPQSRPKGQSR